eukprot:358155-Chlamydomonas_euryale.AAC.2
MHTGCLIGLCRKQTAVCHAHRLPHRPLPETNSSLPSWHRLRHGRWPLSGGCHYGGCAARPPHPHTPCTSPSCATTAAVRRSTSSSGSSSLSAPSAQVPTSAMPHTTITASRKLRSCFSGEEVQASGTRPQLRSADAAASTQVRGQHFDTSERVTKVRGPLAEAALQRLTQDGRVTGRQTNTSQQLPTISSSPEAGGFGV